MITFCDVKTIPITIVSGGIGNLIETSLIELGNFDRIKVISNCIDFDEKGFSIKFCIPEVRADKSKLLEGTKTRKNLIVMGDLLTVI